MGARPSTATIQPTEQGLEVMVTGSSTGTYEQMLRELKMPSAGGATSSTPVSSSDYQEAYRQKKAAEQAEAEKRIREEAERIKRAEGDPVKKQAEQKRLDEEKMVTGYITRARELQIQLSYWKGQSGQGQYTDGIINDAIERLTSELNGIPSAYR